MYSEPRHFMVRTSPADTDWIGGRVDTGADRGDVENLFPLPGIELKTPRSSNEPEHTKYKLSVLLIRRRMVEPR
jgi:hypothetical protein